MKKIVIPLIALILAANCTIISPVEARSLSPSNPDAAQQI